MCVCHIRVIFVSFMNKSLIFRPGDRPTEKRPKKSRLDFYVIYNIKIKKNAPTRPRASRAHHARMYPSARAHHARTRKIIYTTTCCCIYILGSPLFVKFFCIICFHVFQIVSIFVCNIYIYILQRTALDYILTTWQVVDFITQNAFSGELVPWFCKCILLLFISYISIYYTFMTINFYMYIFFLLLWNT